MSTLSHNHETFPPRYALDTCLGLFSWYMTIDTRSKEGFFSACKTANILQRMLVLSHTAPADQQYANDHTRTIL